MDLQEQLEVGHQAEAFLQYLSEHPYFEGLLERMRLELARQILDLMPNNTQDFTVFRSQISGVDLIMNAISGDIYIAQEALKKLNGTIDDNKGLL